MRRWRDPWTAVGVVGTLLACVACLTPAAALLLGALGLAAWAGWVDLLAVPLLILFLGLAVHRLSRARGGRRPGPHRQQTRGPAQGRM